MTIMTGRPRRVSYSSEGPVRFGELRDFFAAVKAPPEAVVELTVNDRGRQLPQEWWLTVRWTEEER